MEIYHLHFGRGNKARYTVKFQYEIEKKRGILNRLIGRGTKKEIVSTTHTFVSASRTAKNRLAFDLSELPPGEHELTVEVTDTVSMQKKQRKTKIKISDQ